MLLKSVRIEHFRCIRDQTLDLEQLTALIGPNGSGKSTILRALQCFFEGAPRFSEDDFHWRQIESDVSISLTFGDLREPETELFRPYIDRDLLTITRRFSGDPSRPTGRYYASRLQNPDFAAVYDAPSAAEKRREYNSLRDGTYSSLPGWTNQTAALETLKAWELEHPAACQRRPDDGQFFGFENVGNGNLAKFVRFVYVPAVRDASDDVAEGRSSPITKLLDFVVRNALKRHAGLEALRAEVRARYRDLVNPQSIESLSALSTDLTTTLQRFYPRANVRVAWQDPDDITLPNLKGEVFLQDDDFEARVGHVGHGLQRAFILAILQHLAVALDAAEERATEEVASDSQPDGIIVPTLLLAVEEPELYQHPSRQRHLARVLLSIVETGYQENRVQVIFSTHSPSFVNVERFHEIRRICKARIEEAQSETRIVRADGDRVALDIWRAAAAAGSQADPFTFATLQPRLHIMDAEVSEGFFADLVILVEGSDDRAAILAMAECQDIDLEAQNMAVIACGGKNNLDKPKSIFANLGIPTYVIWDGDFGRRGRQDERNVIAANRLLLGLHGRAIEDWPRGVYDTYAVFEDKLETTLEHDIGTDFYHGWFNTNAEGFGFRGKDEAAKNPYVMTHFLREALSNSLRPGTLIDILEAALRLAPRQ